MSFLWDIKRKLAALDGLGWLAVAQFVVTSVLAAFSWSVDRRVKEVDAKLKTAQAELAEVEGRIKVRVDNREENAAREKILLQLFEKTYIAVEKGSDAKGQAQRAATRALIESMLPIDDPFRRDLTKALGGDDSAATDAFLQLNARAGEKIASLVREDKIGIKPSELGNYFLDIFYCPDSHNANQLEAEQIKNKLDNPVSIEARVRPLHPTVNASPGMGVRFKQVRYEFEERSVLSKLRDALPRSSDFAVAVVKSNTPHYISIFVCPGDIPSGWSKLSAPDVGH